MQNIFINTKKCIYQQEWLVLQIKRLLSQNIKINKTTLDEKIMSSSSSLEINVYNIILL